MEMGLPVLWRFEYGNDVEKEREEGRGNKSDGGEKKGSCFSVVVVGGGAICGIRGD